MDDWEEKDVGDTDASDGFFVRNLLKLLHECARLAGASSGYCAVSGIEVGQFVMVGNFGSPGMQQIQQDLAGAVQGINESEIVPLLNIEHHAVFLPLIGSGELYGFIRLWGEIRIDAPQQQELSRVAGEFSAANFARRVQVLSLPSLELAGNELNLDLSNIERRLIEITALSFGADGAILRRYVPETESLTTVEFAGDVHSDLLVDRAPGEMVTGSLLVDRSRNWTIVELAPRRRCRGCEVAPETVSTLQGYGLKAMIAVRLDDPIHPDGPPLGTISYFFKRPNTFSWRDVTLFLGFCKRAADVIALARETAIMVQQNRMLEIQSDMAMRAEVASLLVHDLFHKVFHVHERGKDFMDASRKQLRNLRAHIPAEISAAEHDFEIAVADLEREVNDLRSVGRLDDSDKPKAPTKFRLAAVVDRLLRTMKAPMASQKIETKVEIPPDITIIGQEKILERILLTFLLNTIDAAKSRGSSRPMSMFLSATVDGEWIVLKIWDSGPGINLAALALAQRTQTAKPSDVFTIGLSTKKGTGLGLPLARNQLTRFFSGQMKLEDPKTALFELRIKRIND